MIQIILQNMIESNFKKLVGFEIFLRLKILLTIELIIEKLGLKTRQIGSLRVKQSIFCWNFHLLSWYSLEEFRPQLSLIVPQNTNLWLERLKSLFYWSTNRKVNNEKDQKFSSISTGKFPMFMSWLSLTNDSGTLFEIEKVRITHGVILHWASNNRVKL